MTSLVDILGDQCPECGWTRGRHRPFSEHLDPCPLGNSPFPEPATMKALEGMQAREIALSYRTEDDTRGD